MPATLPRNIRIEPDWNVKVIAPLMYILICLIRIEPDWNVKLPYGPWALLPLTY